MSEKLLNINYVTKGAIAVIASQVLPKEEEGLTAVQTAKSLNISVANLNLMRLNNKGPSCYRSGNGVLYKPSSVKAFIKQANSKNQKQKIGA